jgi:hypothetical protein
MVALSHTFIKNLYTYVDCKIFDIMKRFDWPGEYYEDTIGGKQASYWTLSVSLSSESYWVSVYKV